MIIFKAGRQSQVSLILEEGRVFEDQLGHLQNRSQIGGDTNHFFSSRILLAYPPASFDGENSQGQKREHWAPAYVQVISSITCPDLSHIILAFSYNSVSSTHLEIKSSSRASFKMRIRLLRPKTQLHSVDGLQCIGVQGDWPSGLLETEVLPRLQDFSAKAKTVPGQSGLLDILGRDSSVAQAHPKVQLRFSTLYIHQYIVRNVRCPAAEVKH